MQTVKVNTETIPQCWGSWGGLALSAFKQKSEEHNPKKESTILRRKKNTIS